MAIDPVREKHETWIRGTIFVAILVGLAFVCWHAVQDHQAWDDIVRQYWLFPFLAINLLPGRWTFLQLVFMPVVIWVDIHDKPLDADTFQHLPWHDWMLAGLIVFQLGILTLVFLQKKVPPGGPREKVAG